MNAHLCSETVRGKAHLQLLLAAPIIWVTKNMIDTTSEKLANPHRGARVWSSHCFMDGRFSGECFLSARGWPWAMGFTFRQLSWLKDSNIARSRELPIDCPEGDSCTEFIPPTSASIISWTWNATELPISHKGQIRHTQTLYCVSKTDLVPHAKAAFPSIYVWWKLLKTLCDLPCISTSPSPMTYNLQIHTLSK